MNIGDYKYCTKTKKPEKCQAFLNWHINIVAYNKRVGSSLSIKLGLSFCALLMLVSFPDPAFIESGSGTFRAISCIC